MFECARLLFTSHLIEFYMEWFEKVIFLVFMYLIFNLLFISCQSDHMDDNLVVELLTENILNNPVPIPLSTVAESSSYIIIDTTGGHYLSDLRMIRNAGDDYLLVDSREIVYIIDSTGRVKNKFQHKGDGPGEYLEIDDIAVDPKNQNIYLKARQLIKIIKYDARGNLLGEIPVRDCYINKLAFTDSNLIGISSFPTFLGYERSPDFFFIYDRNLKLINSIDHPLWHLPDERYFINPIMNMRIALIGEGLVFYEMYQNGRIFQLLPDINWSIRQWLNIRLENNISNDRITQAGNFLSGQDALSGRNFIEDMVITPGFVYINVVYDNIFDQRSVLYNVKNKSFVTVSDKAGYHRMWDDVNGFFSFWPMGYLEYTNELYYFQDPGKMLREYNEAVDIYPGYGENTDFNIINLFQDAKDMGNPVIQLVKVERH